MTDAAALLQPRDLPRVEKRPEGQSDHDFVETWRARGPMAVDRYGFFWTFSHAQMLACTDPATTRQVETETVRVRGITEGPIFRYFDNALLFANGRVHQARRRPLARTFAFKLMEGMRGAAREVTEGLVRPRLGEEIDFLGEVAGPLPARIIAAILGIPDADVPWFSTRVYSAMRTLSLRSDEVLAEAGASLAELDDYVDRLLDARRAAPREDFLTDYARGVADSGLSADEVRAQITSVILAGADTTRMALCSTLSQLLRRPEQWRALCEDPDGLKRGAAAEGLRFDPVIGSLPRVAIREFELSGVRVPEGTVLAPLVIAALRDPAVYAEPGRFDILRDDHPRYHPVFGAGAHRCLGEALARAELEEALAVLAREAPGSELVRAPVLRGLSGARGIDAMRVRLAG